MPRSITLATTPEELALIVKETIDVLKSSRLEFDERSVYAQFEVSAAEKHGIPVEDWRALWVKTAPPVPAVPPTPEPVIAAERKAPRLARKAASVEDRTYFWMHPKDLAFLELWAKLDRSAGLPGNVLDTGPSGAGKTEKFSRFAERIGKPLYRVDCPAIMTPEDWVGHKGVNETGTYYELSQHLRWVQATDMEPGIVLYDEVNRLAPYMLNVLIPILAGTRRIWVPELAVTIDVHPDTLFAATANLGAGFQGTYPLDDALDSRFGFRLETTWPPRDEEVTILVRRTGIEKAKAEILVDIAGALRGKVPDPLDKPLSTRNLLETANLVAAGMTISDAADYTFIRMYSDEGGSASQRTIVKQHVSGKASGK